jgi:LuxR family transcriptional regulator, maltose regulon positive regulatory protein
LLACLVGALEPHDLPWRMSPEALPGLVAGPPAQRRDVLPEVVNALAAADVARGVIVFEGAHRVDDPAVLEFLGRLIERLPSRWTAVVSSRIDPPPPLARRRAAGELRRLRGAAQRFTEPAVRALLGARGRKADAELPPPPAGSAADAHAGLGRGALVPALGETRHGSAGASVSERRMFDHLAAEVLERIAADHSDMRSARGLESSPHTLRRDVANILDRIGVDSRGQAQARGFAAARRGRDPRARRQGFAARATTRQPIASTPPEAIRQ